MAHVGQMAADLVGTSRDQLHLQKRTASVPLQGLPGRFDIGAALPGAVINLRTVCRRVFFQIAGKPLALRNIASGQAEIILGHGPLLQHGRKLSGRRRILACQHQAAGVPVQTVADPRAEAPRCRKRVLLPAEIACQIFVQRYIRGHGLLGEHPRRLVDCDHLLILIDDEPPVQYVLRLCRLRRKFLQSFF